MDLRGSCGVPAWVVCFHWCGFDINLHVTTARIVISLVVDEVVIMIMMVVIVLLLVVVVIELVVV